MSAPEVVDSVSKWRYKIVEWHHTFTLAECIIFKYPRDAQQWRDFIVFARIEIPPGIHLARLSYKKCTRQQLYDWPHDIIRDVCIE
jgi:hypothetical protein